jgi:hypothetical protein
VTLKPETRGGHVNISYQKKTKVSSHLRKSPRIAFVEMFALEQRE